MASSKKKSQRHIEKYSPRTNCLWPRPKASRIFLPPVLPCPMTYDNKIEFQKAPPTDAQISAGAYHAKFGVRELALAFTAQPPPRPRISTPRLLKPHLKLLIANLELEFLANHTKRSLLRFSNRKKIAVFHSAPSRRRRTATRQHISNRNSRFTGFKSTCCKHTPYQISNRDKNAYFAFPNSASPRHESHAATREPRTTARAAFRSTIPARPHGYR